MTRDDLEALERRLKLLESAVRALANQLEQVRAVQRKPDDVPAVFLPVREPPVPPTPRNVEVLHLAPSEWAMPSGSPGVVAPAGVWKAPPGRDWEALIGRYGTLILATVTGLAAVGTFIGWAIANGWLGPVQRVVLGLIAAAGLAVAGIRLRPRERAFGASLLGLALATTHVCAWGAGPALHLVPDWAALALVAVASLTLEAFAHLENDEALWSVGFFGAAIAPFVTASNAGNALVLAAYGVGVLVSGGYALGRRPWRVAGRLFVLSAALYTGSLALRSGDASPMLAVWFPIAVGLLGVLRWTSGWPRRHRLRALGVLAGVCSVGAGIAPGFALGVRVGLLATAGVVWIALVAATHAIGPNEPSPPRDHVKAGDWVDAAAVPLAILAGVLAALGPPPAASDAALSVATAVLLSTIVWYPAGALRDAAVTAMVVTAAGASRLLADGHPVVIPAAISIVGAACFAGWRWRPSTSWTALGAIVLGLSLLAALGRLGDRMPYTYAPFLTAESAMAAVVLAALATAWWLAREPRAVKPLQGAALVWAFVWAHQEIAFAFNRTAATLLRVAFYAGTSVAAVGVGRARGIALSRHVGLGFAVLTAVVALASARQLPSTGARILADLIAAGFLLAIAYWYRRPGLSPQASEPTGPQSSLM